MPRSFLMKKLTGDDKWRTCRGDNGVNCDFTAAAAASAAEVDGIADRFKTQSFSEDCQQTVDKIHSPPRLPPQPTRGVKESPNRRDDTLKDVSDKLTSATRSYNTLKNSFDFNNNNNNDKEYNYNIACTSLPVKPQTKPGDHDFSGCKSSSNHNDVNSNNNKRRFADVRSFYSQKKSALENIALDDNVGDNFNNRFNKRANFSSNQVSSFGRSLADSSLPGTATVKNNHCFSSKNRSGDSVVSSSSGSNCYNSSIKNYNNISKTLTSSTASTTTTTTTGYNDNKNANPATPIESSNCGQPPPAKLSKQQSEAMRKIWSPPKELEPKEKDSCQRPASRQPQTHWKQNVANEPTKHDAATPTHPHAQLYPQPFFHHQYFHPFHHQASPFFFRPIIFDERVMCRPTPAANFNHYNPLALFGQSGNYTNLNILTPPPQALTPPVSSAKNPATDHHSVDFAKVMMTIPGKGHGVESTLQKSFPSPVSPASEVERLLASSAQMLKIASATTNAAYSVNKFSSSSNNGATSGVLSNRLPGNRFLDNKDVLHSSGNNNISSHANTKNISAGTALQITENRQNSGSKSHPAGSQKSSSSLPSGGGRRGSNRRSSSFQEGVTIGYTYDAFFVSDGRSKRRNQNILANGGAGKAHSDFVPTSSSSSSMDSSSSDDNSKLAVGSSSATAISTTSSQLQNNSVGVAETADGASCKSGYQQQFFTIAQQLLGQPSENRTRYKCSECGKHYATSSNLSRHKQTHRSLDSQQAKRCPHCGKVYVSMPALSMHVLTHDLKYQCRVCQKSFSRPWLLQGHLRSHTGEKPFGCAHCGKAFADRSNLRAHMQTHSSFKLHTCKRCCKSFALKAYLNKHQESACYKDDNEAAKLDASSSCNSCSNSSDALVVVAGSSSSSGGVGNCGGSTGGNSGASVVDFVASGLYQRLGEQNRVVAGLKTSFNSYNSSAIINNNNNASTNNSSGSCLSGSSDNFHSDNAVDGVLSAAVVTSSESGNSFQDSSKVNCLAVC